MRIYAMHSLDRYCVTIFDRLQHIYADGISTRNAVKFYVKLRNFNLARNRNLDILIQAENTRCIDKSFKYLNWDDRKYHNIMVLKNLKTADNLLSDTVIDQKAGFPT